MGIRTRFAPSPTGYLHIGGLRTALYNFLFARKNKGKMLVRVEDTDRERYVTGALESLIETLSRMGIRYDEGPFIAKGRVVQKGPVGPYIQSERLKTYAEHADQLVLKGSAYRCFCSKDRLDSLRKQQELAKLPMRYDRHCLPLTKDEIAAKLSANEAHVIRLKVPEGETSFDDMIRGRIVIKNSEVDDQVLLKSDGFPTYHLAVVVDDSLMGVTHVIRGEEWISSAPKHVLLYRAFAWPLPAFAHLPLILNPDRSKLSKRQGDVAVEDFLDKGYLPEALVNFVALLGWNPKADQELYSMEELAELFDLTKVNKSGAVFNIEKLDWMNGQYIRSKPAAELVALCTPYLERAGKRIEAKQLERICAVERERLVTLSDIVEKAEPYAAVPEYDPLLLVWKKADPEDARQNLEGLLPFLTGLETKDFSSVELLEAAISRYIKESGLKNGNVLWPLRVALSGRSASPSPFELGWVLGKEETARRVESAIAKLPS